MQIPDMDSPIALAYQPDGEWMAVFNQNDLRHVSAFGRTPEQAIRELLVVAALQIGTYQAMNDEYLRELSALRAAASAAAVIVRRATPRDPLDSDMAALEAALREAGVLK